MADKEKKQKRPSIMSSLRRSLVRPPPNAEEVRPILPGQARPSLKGPPRQTGRAAENFEISLRDKSDATAKRGFRVQVPKRMLSYAVLVFIVAPLALFMYLEVHRVAANHEKVPEHHFHHDENHDALSLLTDQEEGKAGETDGVSLVANGTAVENGAAETGNTTDMGDATDLSNATLVNDETEAKQSNATVDTETGASNQTVIETEQKAPEEDKEDSKTKRRVLQKSKR